MSVQPVQLKMARAALDLSVEQLAAKAALSAHDVAAVESGADVDSTSVARLRATLEAAGIEWIDDNGVRISGLASTGIDVEDLTTDNDSGVS